MTNPVSVPPWPDLREEDRWLTTAMEDQLRRTGRSAEELRARARELRAEADQTDIRAYRNVCLTLAARYEEAASTRLETR